MTTEARLPTWKRAAATVLSYVVCVSGGLWIALAALSLNSETSPNTLSSAAANATAGLGNVGVWVLGLFVLPGLISLAIRDRVRDGPIWFALSAALVWGLWTAILVGIVAAFSGGPVVSIPGGGFGLAGIAAAAGGVFGALTSRDIRRR
jgi:hypothetical protein